MEKIKFKSKPWKGIFLAKPLQGGTSKHLLLALPF